MELAAKWDQRLQNATKHYGGFWYKKILSTGISSFTGSWENVIINVGVCSSFNKLFFSILTSDFYLMILESDLGNAVCQEMWKS